MENKTKTIEKKHISLLEDIIFYLIIIPLIIVNVIIIYQKLVNLNKIPDIFGYKMFIVLYDNMDKVTIHRIINITEDNIGRQFEIQNSTNEVGDTKN